MCILNARMLLLSLLVERATKCCPFTMATQYTQVFADHFMHYFSQIVERSCYVFYRFTFNPTNAVHYLPQKESYQRSGSAQNFRKTKT